jgi:hypothetical protein
MNPTKLAAARLYLTLARMCRAISADDQMRFMFWELSARSLDRRAGRLFWEARGGGRRE